MTINESTTSDTQASDTAGVTVHFTVRVRNHGTAEDLRREYEMWAESNGLDAEEPMSAVTALQELSPNDVTVTSFNVETEQGPAQAGSGEVADQG